jgi:hypothetical protein
MNPADPSAPGTSAKTEPSAEEAASAHEKVAGAPLPVTDVKVLPEFALLYKVPLYKPVMIFVASEDAAEQK